jgi:hypothetical protein
MPPPPATPSPAWALREERLLGVCAVWSARLQDDKSPQMRKAVRKVMARLKAHQLRKAAISTLHWLPTDLRTTYDQLVRAAFAQGLTVAALDTEYQDRLIGGGQVRTELTEIGWSVYQDGMIASRHLRLLARPKKKTKPFRYGVLELACRQQAAEELRHMLANVDVVLFWQADGDLNAIRRALGVTVPAHQVLDVINWQYSVLNGVKQFWKLQQYCKWAGVAHEDTHNAGNDARVLLDATLRAVGLRGNTKTRVKAEALA